MAEEPGGTVNRLRDVAGGSVVQAGRIDRLTIGRGVRDDPERLARELLDRVATAETRTLQQLLGDTGDPRPAEVGFVQPKPGGRWRVDGGDRSGSSAEVAAFYRSLRLGRMVVLGAAGAGKTVLLIRLLRDLARAGAGDRVRVPVRLSLPAFPAQPEETPPAVVRDRLLDWVAETLTTVHGVRPRTARLLVRDGWVLPVLDGLDEMDPDGADPVRAAPVLAALNVAAGEHHWPVVLSCRTARYQRLADADGALQDATVITVQPLTPQEIAGWLAHRFPGPDGVQRRWQPVLTRIRRRPHGTLARCLGSPLRLYLAVTVYRPMDSKPGELCQLAEADLDDHLLAQLIPAVAAHHPRPEGGRYAPDDVHRWLRTLAVHLAEMGAAGRSATDLHLHEIWRTTGHPAHRGRQVRTLAAFVVAAAGAVPLFGMFAVLPAITGIPMTFSVFAAVVLGTAFGVRFIFAADGVPQRLDFRRLATTTGRRRVALAAAARFRLIVTVVALVCGFGLVAGLFAEEFAVAGYLAAFLCLFAGCLVGAVTVVLLSAVEVTPDAADRPSEPMRQALARDLTWGTGAALAALTTTAVCGLLVSAVLGWPPAQLVRLGLYWGLAELTLVAGWSAWPRYLLGVRYFRARGALPGRVGRFLDWAYGAGLVRMSGVAVQFRHKELQSWLEVDRRPEGLVYSR